MLQRFVNMYQSTRFVLMMCLSGLGACGGPSPSEGSEIFQGTQPEQMTGPTADAPTLGTIGPIEYGFAPERLTRAEIQLDVPPGYKTAIWATKLIPSERAASLGAKNCRYGESMRLEVCTVEKENGLAMALLERPIADYRRSFANAGVADAVLQPSRVGGSRGFKFTTRADGGGTTYGFYPVGDRTLLLAKRFRDDRETLDPSIASVVDTLRLPEPG